MRVMLVDDRPLMRNGIASLLRAHGHEVVAEANNGQEALTAVEKSSPDLILMDIMLGKMDGLSATRILKKDSVTKDIPVIAITAYALKGDEEKALAAGCSGYISKPIDTRNFADFVAKFITK